MKLWETGHRPGAGLPPGAPRRCLRPGLRPGRPADGHGRLRRLGASLGARGPDLLPDRLPGLSRARPEAWPSRRTADRCMRPARRESPAGTSVTGSTLTPPDKGEATRVIATAPDGDALRDGRTGRQGPPDPSRFGQDHRHVRGARGSGAVDRLLARFPAPRLGRPGRRRATLGRDRPATLGIVPGLGVADQPASSSPPTAGRSPPQPAMKPIRLRARSRLWDVATRQAVGTLRGPAGGMTIGRVLARRHDHRDGRRGRIRPALGRRDPRRRGTP